MLRPTSLSALFLSACAATSLSPSGAPEDARPLPQADASVEAGGFADVCGEELLLDEGQCALLSGFALPATLPPAVGNRYADDLDAARLGFLVFYDPRFAGVPEVRCATCHLPERAFGDGLAVSQSFTGQPLVRNSPSLLNVAWAGPYYFWDGRADSLWSQPLFALEAANEMAGTRLAIAHALHAHALYREKYELVFGPMPDMTGLPLQGKPGDPAYDALSDEQRAGVDRVAANVGKALEAYMRKLATGPSALDRYLAGERSALEPAAKAGLRELVVSGCATCHAGPALSDGAFHQTADAGADPGRAAALAILRDNPFNATGAFADPEAVAGPVYPTQAQPSDQGALRTPTLRNVARTAPYGYDGRYPTLDAFLASGHGGVALTPAQRANLTVLLLSLNGSYPVRPWSDWPAR